LMALKEMSAMLLRSFKIPIEEENEISFNMIHDPSSQTQS